MREADHRVGPPGTCIAPLVKMEFGSLTDQRPIGTHTITPMVAELAPATFVDLRAEVVALEIERSFWGKATILHAEYHCPASQPMRDRFARHYAATTRPYPVQTSTDLDRWAPVSSFTANTGSSATLEVVATGDQRFYRIGP